MKKAEDDLKTFPGGADKGAGGSNGIKEKSQERISENLYDSLSCKEILFSFLKHTDFSRQGQM